MISVRVPIQTVSEANGRQHWGIKARRAKKQRTLARVLVEGEINRADVTVRDIAGPIVVKLTRIGKRRLDCDNLAGSLKAIRDGVADALGIDDGDERLRYVYGQAIGAAYAVDISII